MTLQHCGGSTAACLAAAAVLLAWPSSPAPAAAAQGAAAATSARPGPAGRQFLEMASRGNAAGVAAGRIALQKGRSEDVRRIAQTLIDDHTRAQARLEAVARRVGITTALPDSADPLRREMANRLHAAAAGDEFDRMFVAAQVRDHMMAISLYEYAANLAQDREISSFALNSLPGLRRHADEAVRAAQKMGLSVSAMDIPALAAAGAPPSAGAGPGTVAAAGANADDAAGRSRLLVGTARVGEKLGEGVFYLLPATGDAAVVLPGGTPRGRPSAADTAAPPTAPERGVIAVLDDSFTPANTPELRPGQIVQITGISRAPGGPTGVPLDRRPKELRERILKEPVVLLIRRVSATPSSRIASDGARPGS